MKFSEKVFANHDLVAGDWLDGVPLKLVDHMANYFEIYSGAEREALTAENKRFFDNPVNPEGKRWGDGGDAVVLPHDIPLFSGGDLFKVITVNRRWQSLEVPMGSFNGEIVRLAFSYATDGDWFRGSTLLDPPKFPIMRVSIDLDTGWEPVLATDVKRSVSVSFPMRLKAQEISGAQIAAAGSDSIIRVVDGGDLIKKVATRQISPDTAVFFMEFQVPTDAHLAICEIIPDYGYIDMMESPLVHHASSFRDTKGELFMSRLCVTGIGGTAAPKNVDQLFDPASLRAQSGVAIQAEIDNLHFLITGKDEALKLLINQVKMEIERSNRAWTALMLNWVAKISDGATGLNLYPSLAEVPLDGGKVVLAKTNAGEINIYIRSDTQPTLLNPIEILTATSGQAFETIAHLVDYVAGITLPAGGTIPAATVTKLRTAIDDLKVALAATTADVDGLKMSTAVLTDIKTGLVSIASRITALELGGEIDGDGSFNENIILVDDDEVLTDSGYVLVDA